MDKLKKKCLKELNISGFALNRITHLILTITPNSGTVINLIAQKRKLQT